jgi:integrase
LNALKDIGYKDVMTGHGFRGLATTVLRDRGFLKEHVDVQLSHVNGDKTERAYKVPGVWRNAPN